MPDASKSQVISFYERLPCGVSESGDRVLISRTLKAVINKVGQLGTYL